MRRLSVLFAAVFLSTFLAVTVNAAPAGNSKATEDVPQGLKNARKVMQYKIERDKKMHEKINKGQEKKAEAQLKKELKSQNGKE